MAANADAHTNQRLTVVVLPKWLDLRYPNGPFFTRLVTWREARSAPVSQGGLCRTTARWEFRELAFHPLQPPSSTF